MGIIQRNLKRYAREEDKKNFGLYDQGVITLEECYIRFLDANEITDEIPVDEFEKWLRAEGYGLQDIYE